MLKGNHERRDKALVGLIRALPIILGYLPIGLAYGVLASTAGLSLYSTVAMSFFVYAGSSQLIAVGLIGAGIETAAITMTVFLVNLRHMLMSAYLAPYLGRLKRWQQVLFSYEITDESFAVHSAYFRRQGVPGNTELFSLNMAAHLAWISGSFFGAWLGGRISVDIESYGIDYALPAMFIALLVMQIETKSHILIALLAALLSMAFYLSGMTQLYLILATVAASTAGLFLRDRSIEAERQTGKGENS